MNRIDKILQEKKWRQGLLPVAITGDEKIDVSALTRALAEGIRREGDAVVTLREEDFSADEAADILRTISFDGSASCVLVKDLLFSKMPAAERAKLVELLGDDTAVGCLIISQPTAQEKASDKAAREVLSQFERRGVAIRCDLKKPYEIAEALASRAGGRMTKAQCQALLTRCGGSYATALQEQDKVLSYASGRHVEGADIELIVTEELTASAFEISRKLLAGDLGGALQKADALFQRRESEIMMLAAISTAFIDLQRANADLSGRLPRPGISDRQRAAERPEVQRCAGRRGCRGALGV